MDWEETDVSRVFDIVVEMSYEGQAKYRVKTEHGVIQGGLDATLVLTLAYISPAMKDRVLGKPDAGAPLHYVEVRRRHHEGLYDKNVPLVRWWGFIFFGAAT